MTDSELEILVTNTIKQLRFVFLKSHYNSDIESIVWEAAAVLKSKPIEQQTRQLLYCIAYRGVVRDLNKMRNVYVSDLSEYRIDDRTFEYLNIDSLTTDEVRLLNLIIVSDLSKTDVAKQLNITRQTVHRKWNKILSKLKDDNL